MSDMNFEQELQRVFEERRRLLPDPEASVEFMPRLWDRIEVRRRTTQRFRTVARQFLTMAGALTLAMAAFTYIPGRDASTAYSSTWVEVLDDNPSVDDLDAEAADTL